MQNNNYGIIRHFTKSTFYNVDILLSTPKYVVGKFVLINKKTVENTNSWSQIIVYIASQVASIPMLIGLLGYCLVQMDFDIEFKNDASLWSQIVQTSAYPGGVFNYLSKYFHYYLQTNIFFVTLLPSFLYFVGFSTSTIVYFKVLAKIRSYEFLSYRTRYTKFFGEYT